MNQPDERRRFKRVKEEIGIRITTKDTESQVVQSTTGDIRNLSACGVLFKSDKPYELDSVVKIKFLIPNSFDFFEAEAKVVRIESMSGSSQYEIGVELQIKEDEKNLALYIT